MLANSFHTHIRLLKTGPFSIDAKDFSSAVLPVEGFLCKLSSGTIGRANHLALSQEPACIIPVTIHAVIPPPAVIALALCAPQGTIPKNMFAESPPVLCTSYMYFYVLNNTLVTASPAPAIAPENPAKLGNLPPLVLRHCRANSSETIW